MLLSLSRERQKGVVEALIFAAEEPMTAAELLKIIADTEAQQQAPTLADAAILHELVAEINGDLAATGRPFRVVEVGGGWQFATSNEYGEYVQRLLKSKSRKRLSQAALETLAIIAYRQPVTKPDIEAIRGVNSSEVVNALLEKELVEIAGRAETPGRPLLYSTTLEFLRIFGLKSAGDLPKLRELDEFAGRREIEVSAAADSGLSQQS